MGAVIGEKATSTSSSLCYDRAKKEKNQLGTSLSSDSELNQPVRPDSGVGLSHLQVKVFHVFEGTPS